MMNFHSLLLRFSRDETGATLVEYGLAIALAIFVGIVGLTALGGEVFINIDDATTVLQ